MTERMLQTVCIRAWYNYNTDNHFVHYPKESIFGMHEMEIICCCACFIADFMCAE